MRLDHDHRPVPTLVLSERNLLTLLTKLYTEGSLCTIGGGEDCPMRVKAEPDEVHYGTREVPPGPMHPVTERILEVVRAATEGKSLLDPPRLG